MTKFGTDQEKALAEIRKLADALDEPVGMFYWDGQWVGVPATSLLKVDLDALPEFRIVKPKEFDSIRNR